MKRFRMCLEIKSSRQADTVNVGREEKCGFKDGLELFEPQLEQLRGW